MLQKERERGLACQSGNHIHRYKQKIEHENADPRTLEKNQITIKSKIKLTVRRAAIIKIRIKHTRTHMEGKTL